MLQVGVGYVSVLGFEVNYLDGVLLLGWVFGEGFLEVLDSVWAVVN